MGIEDLVKFAFTGPTGIVYGMLNVWTIAAHRLAIIPQTWGFAIASLLGALVGGFAGYTGAQAEVGVAPPLLMQAVIFGIIIGAGSSTLAGVALSAGADWLNVAPRSSEKVVAEDIRDPLSPTQPK